MSVTMRPDRSTGAEHLRQGGDVAAGEDVLGDEWIGDGGRLRAADGMNHGHAIVVQQVAHLAEEGGVVIDADVLEHADRDDAIEPAFDLAVVLELEAHRARQTFARARFSFDILCCSALRVTPVTSQPTDLAR